MSLPSTLRLRSLKLTNYRGFASCELDLDPSLTVLVAENGCGKTAILDAIAIALGLFVDTVTATTLSHGFDRTDVRLARDPKGRMQPVLPTLFSAVGDVEGKLLTWGRTLNKVDKRARSTTQDAKALHDAALALRIRLQEYADGKRALAPLLPAVVFYGTGRLWSRHKLTPKKNDPSDHPLMRTAGYTDCLSPSSSFSSFERWFERVTLGALQEVVENRTSPYKPQEMLAPIRAATDLVLAPSGWSGITWDPIAEAVVATHPDYGTIPLDLLSDGVRNMIALVADLAHRCVRLNPQLGTAAHTMTPGVVLIDEVDMHLHPRWQQQVLTALTKAFPAMQMVVTTHSPQVISTVAAHSLRVLTMEDDAARITTPGQQTRGVRSGDLLARIMGVDPLPDLAETKLLSAYRALIEDGRGESPEAVDLRTRLIAHYGASHPVILDTDRLLRFQAIRLRKRTEGEVER